MHQRISLFLFLLLCSARSVAFEPPEFDGAYILTAEDELIELQPREAKFLGMMDIAYLASDQALNSSVSIGMPDFKGIVFQGKIASNAQLFSTEYMNTDIFPIGQVERYQTSTPVSVRSKTLGTLTRYIQPRNPLRLGIYAVRAGGSVAFIQVVPASEDTKQQSGTSSAAQNTDQQEGIPEDMVNSGPGMMSAADQGPAPDYVSEFPLAFRGTWNVGESCSDESSTDTVLMIEELEFSYHESRCRPEYIAVSENEIYGQGSCSGEGDTWKNDFDLELVENNVLVEYGADGSSFTRVRCKADRDVAEREGIAASTEPSPAHAAQGVVRIDGTDVRWTAPKEETPTLATFSFQARGYENTYDLDCRTRRFRWASNLDLRTRRLTGNSDGAQWRTLNPGSTKANSAYEAACR